MEWFNFLSSLIRSAKRKRIASYRTINSKLTIKDKNLGNFSFMPFPCACKKKIWVVEAGVQKPIKYI